MGCAGSALCRVGDHDVDQQVGAFGSRPHTVAPAATSASIRFAAAKRQESRDPGGTGAPVTTRGAD